MNWRPLLTILLLAWGRVFGQTAELVIDPAVRQLIRHQMDTLLEMEGSGHLKPSYPFCTLPAHERYALSNAAGFPVLALHYVGEEKKVYQELCALEYVALQSYEQKKYSSALEYWNKALEISIRYKFDFDELHHVRVALNNLFFLQGEFDKVMAISTDGLRRAESIGDKERMAHFNNVLGCIMLKSNNLVAAGNYFHSELIYGKELNDEGIIGHALLNLSDLYQARKNFDSAIISARQAYTAYTLQNGSNLPERITFCNYKISQSFKLWGNNREALEYSNKVIESLAHPHGINYYDRANYAINAAEIYMTLDRVDTALDLLYYALQTAKSVKHREFTRDAYEQLAKAFQLKKRYDSAFMYLQLFHSLRDSLVNENNERDIMQKESNLQLEKQKRSQELAVASQRLWKNIILAICIILLLSIIFFYNRYELKQKNIHQEELMKQQNELFNAVSVAQEQERKRIAQDLHDSLGTVLSAARLKLAALKDSYPAIAAQDHFLSSLHFIDEASSELRNISHNIMPATLSKLGLVPALKNLSEKITSAGDLQVTFITYDLNERLNEKAELSIYRIILELINNVVKHAAANRATVQLIRYPGYINITVEDNGKGFEFNKSMEDKKGLGLASVFARVEYLGGKIDFDTARGKGTTIFIEIPL